jgi:hypothetical protein
VAVAAGAASAALPSGAAHTAVKAAVPSVSVYDAIPNPLPPNVASLGFQSNHTAEFGDYVHLAGTGRELTSVTVTMSDHALYSDYSSDPRYSGNSVSSTHPITVNVYTNHLVNGVPDQKIATVTQTVTIPWLPPGYGFSGIAFNAAFDVSSLNVTLPNDVIVSVASYDPGRFNLLVDGTTYAHNVGDNGTTGQVTVAPGTHVVSETAGTNATLSNYVPRITCSDGSAGYGASLSVSTTAGENLACTITNTRKLYRG